MPRTRAQSERAESGAQPGRPRGGPGVLVLKPGREKSLSRRHPWLFSGAIESAQGAGAAGDTVRLVSAAGAFLAWAAYSPSSQIRARVWSFEEGEAPGPDLLRRKLEAAVALRRARIGAETDAVRLVHAESDGLPGVIADRYGDALVVQLLSAGAERWRTVLIEELARVSGCARIYERSDAEARELEGLHGREGWVLGPADAEPASEIVEHGLRYAVDLARGQKTGFYLDQRDNRRRVGELSAGREVLNCFCYTGGFTLSALAGGARSVLSIDSSGPALRAAQANVERNRLGGAAEWLHADVFRALRDLQTQARRFDLIVLDPPKFAPTPKDAERAARGYKDINMNALRLLRPGGLLATFSCSGGVSADLFQKIVAGAAADAPVSLRLRERLWAAPDHPVLVEFPEGEYLKGLLLERL
jgi:23S rRNA (cytosine1962-C5)-methyltransferase